MSIHNGNPRILVVDDHKTAVEMLIRVFDGQGYTIERAYDGPTAIEVAQEFLPDVILLDIMMPGMNGFEVLQVLRNLPATASCTVIMLTAKDAPTDIETGLKLGADDYVLKPFEPRELIARVNNKIEARNLRDALHSRSKELAALLRVGEHLNQYLETPALLRLILYFVIDLIPCNVAAIYFFDEDENIIDYCATLKDGTQIQKPPFDDYKLVSNVLLQDLPYQWDEPVSWLPEYNCGMAIALRYGDQLNGLMMLANDEAYDTSHFRLFEAISRQAALALKNTELFEKERQYNNHLEEMVQDRTRELRSAQKMLIRSEKMASVGRLAATVAHEINNPLLPIRLSLEDMIEDLKTGKPISDRSLEVALESSDRIQRIVDRLLKFTRGPQNPTDTTEMELVSLADVIDNVLILSHKYIEHANVETVVELDRTLTVLGKRDELEQVYLNLVMNASQAMEEQGGGTLTVKLYMTASDVVSEVHDTGHGIPENMINDIFEPFLSTKDEGTGLGLFITYGIVAKHQGEIRVESVVDEGTRFTILLPHNN